MTLTDAITLATWSQSFTINIPATVGGNTAYVGFTGGSGGLTSSQKINWWTYLPGPPVPNYAAGFAPGGMTLNGGPTYNGTRLRLTDAAIHGEERSAFFTIPVNVQQFSSSFDFQLTDPVGDGFTFAIQGVGPTAKGGGGENLGYAGIANSVAIKFDLDNDAGDGQDSTGLYTDGAGPTLPEIDLSSTGINLHSGDIFNVLLTYNGTVLTVVITDTVTNASATQTYSVDIPELVGSPMAYVGFTGGTGFNTAVQDILNWTYSPVPLQKPALLSGLPLTLNGGAALIGTSLGLTDGSQNEARSAFLTSPVNIQQFNTSFNFQLTNAAADGFTFTIQGDGPTPLGGLGGSLGYQGIPMSVAVKFDLYSNSGEGPDSTGLYINGANPTLPAINLSSTGIDLHSGDIFNAQLTYNGTTLTVVITDTATNATATQTYTVNIPAIVGGPTAYVGFTGASGGATAVQQILSWSFNSGLLTGPEFFSGFSSSSLSQLALNGGATLNGTRLRLTDTTHGGEFRSAFFTTPVSVQQFSSGFDFQLTNPLADGFTFTIQGVGPTARGTGGADLGYGGMPESVAVKFDLFSNAGEGPDSTGLYTNGATPTTPSIDLSSTGVNLHSGDTFNAQLAYNGTVLTVVITDKVTNASATQVYTVNIPAIVGGPTAYVGFTAGTGASTAVQEILNWAYSSGAP